MLTPIFQLTLPYHGESRTLYYVTNEHDDVVATLEMGKVYKTKEGSCYRLLECNPRDAYANDLPPNRVLVQRCDRNHDEKYIWHVYSLFVLAKSSGTLHTR